MSNIGEASIEDEIKGDVYSYAVILWEMMTRKTPWAHCIISFFFHFFFFFFFFLFSSLKLFLEKKSERYIRY